MPAATDLITLTQARTSLRTLPAFTGDDTDIGDLITSATACMDDLCGPIIARAADETHDGGRPNVRLLQHPVVSVTTVTESYGAGYSRPLTLQPVDGGVFDSFGYTVDLHDGVVTRRVAGVATVFAPGRRNIHVVYQAGRVANTAAVPSNLQRATRRLVRWLWQTEMQGMRPANSGPDSPVVTPSGRAIPIGVVELCGADVRITAVG